MPLNRSGEGNLCLPETPETHTHKLRQPSVDDAYHAYVTCFSDPTMALLDLAGRAEIAVAYLDRGAIEADTGRELSDDEWDKIAYELDWYDEHVCGCGELNSAFLDQVFAAAGVERYLDEDDSTHDGTSEDTSTEGGAAV